MIIIVVSIKVYINVQVTKKVSNSITNQKGDINEQNTNKKTE